MPDNHRTYYKQTTTQDERNVYISSLLNANPELQIDFEKDLIAANQVYTWIYSRKAVFKEYPETVKEVKLRDELDEVLHCFNYLCSSLLSPENRFWKDTYDELISFSDPYRAFIQILPWVERLLPENTRLYDVIEDGSIPIQSGGDLSVNPYVEYFYEDVFPFYISMWRQVMFDPSDNAEVRKGITESNVMKYETDAFLGILRFESQVCYNAFQKALNTGVVVRTSDDRFNFIGYNQTNISHFFSEGAFRKWETVMKVILADGRAITESIRKAESNPLSEKSRKLLYFYDCDS